MDLKNKKLLKYPAYSGYPLSAGCASIDIRRHPDFENLFNRPFKFHLYTHWNNWNHELNSSRGATGGGRW